MSKLVLLSILFTAVPAAAQTIYLVRHAERQDDSADTQLSELGRTRAESLKHALKDAGVKRAIITSYVRTKQTAQPLAEHLKLTPQALPADDVKALTAMLDKLTSQDSALVVGHSNTLPDVIAALSGDKITLGHADYDDLFVLRRDQASKRFVLTHLHYGASR